MCRYLWVHNKFAMQFKNDLILLSQQVVDCSFMLYPTQISWLLCMWRSKHINSNGKRTGSYTGIFYLSRQSTLYNMPHSPIHTNTVFMLLLSVFYILMNALESNWWFSISLMETGAARLPRDLQALLCRQQVRFRVVTPITRLKRVSPLSSFLFF